MAVFSRMGCVEMDLPGLKRPRFFVKAKFVVTLLDLEAESEELN